MGKHRKKETDEADEGDEGKRMRMGEGGEDGWREGVARVGMSKRMSWRWRAEYEEKFGKEETNKRKLLDPHPWNCPIITCTWICLFEPPTFECGRPRR